MTRTSLLGRIGKVVAAVSVVPLLAATAVITVGGIEEIRTPATQQVSSWVYRSREIAQPTLYISLAPLVFGAAAYYASKKARE